MASKPAPQKTPFLRFSEPRPKLACPPPAAHAAAPLLRWPRGFAHMKTGLIRLLLLLPGLWLKAADAPLEQISLPGLNQAVEILRDKWGISHIYAGNEHDLFLRKATM